MDGSIEAGLDRLSRAAAVDEPFFDAAAEALCAGLGVKWAAFGWLDGEPTSDADVQIASFCKDGRLQTPFRYSLNGTPCASVYQRDEADPYCFWGDDVAAAFPGDVLLSREGVRSFRGEALFGDNGAKIGHAFVMDDRPADDKAAPKAFFRLVAQRAAAELRREIAARRLADAEARVADYTEIASEWWWETDAQDRFSVLSPAYAQMIGVEPAAMVGMRREDMLHAAPDDLTDETFTLDDWRRHFETLERREPFANVIHPRRAADGSMRYVMISGRPIYDASGAFVGYRNVGRDVTENESMLRALQTRETALRKAIADAEAEKAAKAALLANISHELCTPLNAILGFSEALLAGFLGKIDEKSRSYLKLIHQSGAKLLSLSNQVVDLNLIQDHGKPLKETTVLLNKFIQEAVSEMSVDALDAGVVLRYQPAPTYYYIFADEKALRRIARHLIANAIRFTPQGGDIAIAFEPDGAGFSIADCGEGVRPEDRDEIFRPFKRGGAAFTRKHAGSGLGLTLVRALVELHGGTVSIDDDYLRGARFVVRLPQGRQRSIP